MDDNGFGFFLRAGELERELELELKLELRALSIYVLVLSIYLNQSILALLLGNTMLALKKRKGGW